MAEATLRSTEQLELLYQASLEFGSTLDPDELLPRIFDRAIETLDAEAGSVWLREGEALVCAIARGPVGSRIEGLELPLGAGIVGDVARRGASELVEDARDDPRFVHQVDEATGFETRSMVAAPLRAKDQVLGVLQILNKRSGTGLFDEADRALLEGLGTTAGLALRNAQLHDAERRARDLETLLEISRELTSTLESDRLLLSVVNLGVKALSYDRAAIALDDGGELAVRAVSGREKLDRSSEDIRRLERLIGWLAERGATVYVSDVDADGDLAASVRAAFGEYLQRNGRIRSLALVPLRDEEGRLGALYMEAGQSDFLGRNGREAAELLANQTSVALRNAELYGQVPLIGLLEPVADWRRRLASMPRRRLLWRVGLPVGLVLLFLAIPWGGRIAPLDARLVPGGRMPVRATVGGILSDIHVEEGDEVRAGEPIGRLRADDVRLQLEEIEGRLAAAEREAAAARSRGDEAATRIGEIRAEELRARRDLLREQLARTRLTAPVSGVVLTRRPYEMLGERIDAGDRFVVLGRTDRLELEAWVGQGAIERVRAGKGTVRLKVPARPAHTFVGRVVRIAPHAETLDDGEGPAVAVRAVVDNERGLLKPGMEARAKFVGATRPLGWHLARPLVRWIRLRLWR